MNKLGFNSEDDCFENCLYFAGYLEIFEDGLADLKPLGSFIFGFLFEIVKLLLAIDSLDLHYEHYNCHVHLKLKLLAIFFNDYLLNFIIFEIKIHYFSCFISGDLTKQGNFEFSLFVD